MLSAAGKKSQHFISQSTVCIGVFRLVAVAFSFLAAGKPSICVARFCNLFFSQGNYGWFIT
jgi:hypothetical protein